MENQKKINETSGKGDLWIGIDLGTKNSCVGLWRNGKVEILNNDEGLTITPSCVACKPDQ